MIKNYNKKKVDSLTRSMFFSTICKPLSMVISLLYTPILLNYLGSESFGIWSTILSVINWVNYFDIGIGNGLRNMLTIYLEKNDTKGIKLAVSTGYIILSLIAMVIMLLGTIIILFLNDKSVFNTTINVKPALMTSFIFICINFVLSLSKVQLYSIQQAEKVGYMTLATQVMNLIGILFLSLFTKNNIFYVAIIVGMSGILANLYYTGKIWNKFNCMIPSLHCFDKKKLKGICNVGIKFFLVQIAALILYSTDNMIIIYLFGPEEVTPYNTVYSAFGILNGLFAAMIAPLWSKYTIAVQKKNYSWIKNTILKLDKILPLIIILLIIANICFEPISVLWLHRQLYYRKGLISCMAVYYFLTIWGSIYANAMNGMGRINLQLIMGILSALVNIPFSIFLGKYCDMGNTGVALSTIVCMLVTNIIITFDMHRYLNYKIKKN